MKVRQLILVSLGLFFISAGLSFALTHPVAYDVDTPAAQEATTDDDTELGLLLKINPEEPKTESCPLNGKLYSATEKSAWEARRPLAVMIENSPDARPQSGLSSADLVFEAVAEGGVTRFMAMFYCDAQKQDVTIAPVRSARTYFVDWASGFNRPLYAHVGGANLPGPTNALGQISDYGWSLENDLNQFSIGYPTFIRNNNRLNKEVATEHTMETTSEKLWAVGLDRGWTNMSPELKIGRKVIPATDWKDGFTPWQYLDNETESGTVTKIAYDFWSGYNQFSVSWEYDPSLKLYKRVLAQEPHLDLNTNQQIGETTVVVLFTDEKGPVNELKHMLYRTTGTGKALVFSHGNVDQITWSKKDREAQLQFLTKSGKAYQFNRGSIWISVLDESTKVEY